MINITEDTPPDMLTGAMDLTVQLPTLEKTVKMSVERSTPMMDVLVLITTQFNLQVSRYQIEALGMAPSLEYSDKVLPYRPNTPLGALDTQHIRVIRKMKAAPPPRPVNKGVASQPFENTFRLKVHLPQNQLYVTRVGKNIYLNDIMTKVCDEKNLDSRKYEFRHPGNQDQILDAKLTLNDYQITEIYLVSKGTFTDFSNKDIMAFQREEERKRLHTKAGGGVVNLIYKRGRNSLEYTSVPNENQSVSPSQSDDSRSVTPPAVQSPLITINNTINKEPKDQPKAPLRKRKPAPKPPTIQPAPDQPMIIQHQPIQTTFTINPTVTIKPSSSTEAIVDSVPSLPVNNDTVTNICHSRTSSDSSGYHEASILSDNLVNNSSLPRLHQRPKTIIGSHEIELRKGHGRGIHGDHSKSTGNLMTLASKSKSTISLITTGRKKKAAPLPPTPLPSLTQVSAQEHAQSLTIPSATNTLTTIATPVENILMESIPDLDSTLEEKKNDFDQIASHQRTSRESADKSNTSSDLDNTDQNQVNKNTETLTNEIPKQDIEPALDWKYELPLPPTAFRDNTHDNLDNLTQYDTTTLVSERCRGDSVVSNSELFEKLNKLQGNLSDTATTVSVTSTEYDSKSMYNKLSLEQLQNRKSLVYNREIATTLKSPDSPIRDSFKSELEDAVLQTQIKPARVKPNTSSLQQGGGLPNFKITTYDEPKSKIKIFEDDTSRSYEPAQENNDISYKTRSLMRNQHNGPSANAAANRYTPVVRSGSFSINTWTVVNPLKRSTSQAALIHRQNEEETNEAMNMSTATSTIDVTMNNAGGLQSIGVMKQIQNSLQSPTIDTVDSKHIELDDEIEIRRNSLQNSIDNHKKDVEANINSYTLPYPTKKKEVIPLRRWSPPDITLGTWDDRPKTAVFVRQDSNYKFKRANVLSGVSNTKNSYKSGGLFVISNNNVAPQHDSFEEEPFASREQANHITNGDHNVSIKINGSESISSSSETGNVTIRIGSSSNVNNNTEPSVTPQINFRKPFGNINTFVRPHSIAIDTNYEVSRRPVVTSATLKKSITQINNNNNNYSVPLKKPERPNSVYLMNNNNTNQNSNYSVNYNTNRKSWNALLSQGKLISNSNEHLSNKSSDSSYNTNVNVPFSQMRLKRTDSSKMLTQPTANGTEMGFGRVLDSVPNRIVSNDCKVDRRQQNGSAMLYCPPIPPPLKVMPTNTKATRHQTYSAEDKRSSLLSEIQNFGGKKGLRTIRT